MRDVQSLLIQYAHYHRDPRNIATHLLGIPLIVLAVGVLLSHPTIPLAGREGPLHFSPAWALWLAASLWYLLKGLRGHLGVALFTCVCNAGVFALSHVVAAQAGDAWLGWGVGLFVLGWAIQFLGHYYEGRKPAFVDDLVGLLVGPMFVYAEMLFAAGLARGLKRAIEAEAGPVRLRDLHGGALKG